MFPSVIAEATGGVFEDFIRFKVMKKSVSIGVSMDVFFGAGVA